MRVLQPRTQSVAMAACEAIRDDSPPATNAKAKRMLNISGQRKLMYEQLVHPSLLTVHDQDRSGIMLNSHACHGTGLKVLKMGWQSSKVKDSLNLKYPKTHA